MDIFGNTAFAEEAAPSTAVPAEGEAASGKPEPTVWSSGMEMFLIFFLLLIAMWFLMIRPQQKEQKRRQSMWDSLRKTDKVATIGGIHGVVTEIDRQNDTVTLRVDETNNVKITVWTNSIAQILSEREQ